MVLGLVRVSWKVAYKIVGRRMKKIDYMMRQEARDRRGARVALSSQQTILISSESSAPVI